MEADSIDILETACFPKGCMFDSKAQLLIALSVVPKLRASSMTAAEWTRGAQFLEEPFYGQTRDIVCRGCHFVECVHNLRGKPGDLMCDVYGWGYADRHEKDEQLLEALLPKSLRDEWATKDVVVDSCGPSTSNKWFRMFISIKCPGRDDTTIVLTRKKGEQGDVAVYGAARGTYPLPTTAAAVSHKLREIIDQLV